MPTGFVSLVIRLVIGSFLGADASQAGRLEVAAEEPAWVHAGAAILLYSHIAGGAIGLLAGSIASVTRKGGPAHRAAGKAFLVAMFISYVIGAGVAPFLTEGQRHNFVAGLLALYLLVTGVGAAKRGKIRAGRAEYIGLATATVLTGLGVLFMAMAASSDRGTVDGSPPQAFYVFVLAGAAAAAGDLHLILKGSLSEAARITRHQWRMCASFFFASGSLFLGQPKVFPAWFNESILPVFLAFVPIMVMVFWLIRSKMAAWGRSVKRGAHTAL